MNQNNCLRLYQKSELPQSYFSPTTEAVGSNFVTSIEPRPYQKPEQFLIFCSPTTEAVGSNFVTSIAPTALVVGALTNIWK
jgi:hypothetical protein